MRQEHRADDKFFVDYSGGQTVPIVDADRRDTVGPVMGNSNQTYAEDT